MPILPSYGGSPGNVVQEVRMGLDELHRAVAMHPEKVVDTIRAMCDHYDQLVGQAMRVPPGAADNNVALATLQGRALAIETLLGEFVDRLTTDTLEDKEQDDDDSDDEQPRI